MSSPAPFRIWIRRAASGESPYAVRFEVFDGTGVLRVARPGILIDPPARVSGFEESLTASQIRASRFLHVWAGGRKRQSHILSRLSDQLLEGLGVDRWVELLVVVEGGYRYLDLDGAEAQATDAPIDRQQTDHEGHGGDFEEDEVTEIRPGDVPSTSAPPPRQDASRTDIPAAPGSVFSSAASGGTILVRMLRREMMAKNLRILELEAKLAARQASSHGNFGFDDEEEEDRTVLKAPPEGFRR